MISGPITQHCLIPAPPTTPRQRNVRSAAFPVGRERTYLLKHNPSAGSARSLHLRFIVCLLQHVRAAVIIRLVVSHLRIEKSMCAARWRYSKQQLLTSCMWIMPSVLLEKQISTLCLLFSCQPCTLLHNILYSWVILCCSRLLSSYHLRSVCLNELMVPRHKMYSADRRAFSVAAMSGITGWPKK